MIHTYTHNRLYTIVPTFLLVLLSLVSNLNASEGTLLDQTTTSDDKLLTSSQVPNTTNTTIINGTNQEDLLVENDFTDLDSSDEEPKETVNDYTKLNDEQDKQDKQDKQDELDKQDKLIKLVASIGNKNDKNLSDIVNFISDIKKDKNLLSLKEATESITYAINRLATLVLVLMIGMVIAFFSNGKKVEDNINNNYDYEV